MTATERLRQLLDERGVRWEPCSKADIDNQTFCRGYTFTEFFDGLMVTGLTPEQAVEATLGRGTCHVAYKHPEYPCSNDEICSECGASFYFIGEVNYCPNCGRRVEE